MTTLNTAYDTTWVCLNGELTLGPQAKISVFDRGFLFGDAVYEVLRTAGGEPVFLGEHLDRLWRSAELLALAIPVDRATLVDEIQAVVARFKPGEAYLRVMITRGVASDLRVDAEPIGVGNRLIFGKPLLPLDPVLMERGCALKTFGVANPSEGLISPQAKSANKVVAILAQAQARQAGAYEALRVDPTGQLLEGATSTFFAVRAGVLLTPPLGAGILPGITRAKVLALAASLGIPTQEVALHLTELPTFSEALITSSVRGLVPVRQIDECGYGVPGPVTEALLKGYARLLSLPGYRL